MNKISNLYRTSSPTVTDAFDNVVANICLQKEKKGYTSFMLTGCEPGVGTTTIAVELAISLAHTGWKTILLDVDMRKNSAFKHLNEHVITGLTDYIREQVEAEDIIYNTNMELLDYIPCGNIKNNNPLRMLYSHRTSKLLSVLNSSYNFVILDVPAINSSVDANILSVKADAVILVAALDGSSRKYLEDAKNRLENDGANIIGVIQNKASIEAYKDYLKDFDYFTEKRYLKGNHLAFEKDFQPTKYS